MYIFIRNCVLFNFLYGSLIEAGYNDNYNICTGCYVQDISGDVVAKPKDGQDPDLKKELRKAKSQLKQCEAKIKSMEEEHKNQVSIHQ